MFRKLILASAVSLALLPAAAEALSLGGISAQSALNEPFAGQIELLEIDPDHIGTVTVLLASEEEFNKAGAPRPGFLNGLSFTPEVSPQGSPVIRVSSREPVREPYLDFLIEVKSPAGQSVKEYTVLLDPPVTVDSPSPRVEQPVIVPPEAPRAAPAAPAASRESAPSSADASAFPMRYGPVESGAGLWKIARKMAAKSGASVSQTAMALYRSNQQAFIRGDINLLKVGKVLEIPTSAELHALDAPAADRQFKAALRGDTVTATPLTDITAARAPEDRLKIAGTAGQAAPTPTPTEAPSPQSEAQKDVGLGAATTSEGAQKGQAGASDLRTVRQDLLLVQESGESNRQETEELRSRVQELETQLADIQRLLKLSDERFAQLQAAGLERPEDLAAETTDAETAPGAEGQTDASGEAESTEAASASDPDEAPPAKAPPVPEVATDPIVPPSYWESMPKPMLALAAVIPLLLGLLGWVVYRRRKSLEEALMPAELAPEAATVAGDVVVASEFSPEHTAESAEVSVPTQSPYSGIENLKDETEEADIVSEADVYIAYGRYREAESLLEEEVGRSPDRLDVKYKLAEAYYGSGDLRAMTAIMGQMHQTGGDRTDPDQWRRLEGMLRDLKGKDSESPAPAASGDGSQDGEASQTPARPRTVTFPPLSPDEGRGPAAPVPGHRDAGDFLKAVSPPDDAQDRRSLDLELEVEDLEVFSGALQVPESEETPEMSGAASDLELQLEDFESLRDLDLASSSNREISDELVSAKARRPATEDVLGDSLDIAPVGKDSLESDALSSQWQMDSGMWDEVATKIDLARAYMEMEDPGAARVILEEVAQEGNEEQRAEAKEMMEQLG